MKLELSYKGEEYIVADYSAACCSGAWYEELFACTHGHTHCLNRSWMAICQGCFSYGFPGEVSI